MYSIKTDLSDVELHYRRLQFANLETSVNIWFYLATAFVRIALQQYISTY